MNLRSGLAARAGMTESRMHSTQAFWIELLLWVARKDIRCRLKASMGCHLQPLVVLVIGLEPANVIVRLL